MTLFFLFAFLMVVAGLGIMLPGILKRSAVDPHDQLQTNIAIAKERKKALQLALDDGSLDQSAYSIELADIEKSLALDMESAGKQAKSASGATLAAVTVALVLPLSAAALYWHLGQPEGIDAVAYDEQVRAERAQAAASGNANAPSLDELLPQLEAKVQERPDDIQGWILLGRTYLRVQDFPNAARALRSGYAIDKSSPDLMAMLAEAEAMVKGGDLSGEPLALLDKALAVNPNHEQSLWLRGIAMQQAGEHVEAISIFKILRAGISGNDSASATLDEMIARSVAAIEERSETTARTSTAEAGTAATSASGAANASTQGAENAATAKLTVSVDISEEARAAVTPELSVFIYARASNGPPAPLAVSRHSVSELPITVTLDDSMAMIPNMTLSQFPDVTVGARVSLTGNPIAQPGDWFAEVNDVRVQGDGTGVELEIGERK